MKLNKLFLLFGAAALLGACSDSLDEPVDDRQVLLTVSPTSIVNDGVQAAQFTATLAGADVTAESKIYMQGAEEPLASNAFTSTTAGTYTFHAVYDQFKSNTVNVKVTSADAPKPGELVLVPSINAIRNNGTDVCHFTVLNDGKEITEGVTLFKDKREHPSLDFTSTESGTYAFFASYGTSISKDVKISVVDFDIPEVPADPAPSSTAFDQRSLAIQFTGLGCGWCPWTIAAIRLIEADAQYKDRVVFTACHTFSGDPMGSATVNAIHTSCSANGWPNMAMNLRKAKYDNVSNVNTNASTIRRMIDAQQLDPAKAGVSATVKHIGDRIVISASVKAAEKGEYFVGAWLLEDGIEGRQSVNGGLEGDFNTHNNVVRGVAGRTSTYVFSGDPLGELDKGATKEHVLMIDLDAKWKVENCKVVIFVSTYDDNDESDNRKAYVNNCIPCAIGASTGFDYK